MTRRELIEKLDELADEAYADRHLPAAAILKTLCGALSEGSDTDLMHVCHAHSSAALERLRVAAGEVSDDWQVEIPR